MSGYLELPNSVELYIDKIKKRCDSLIRSQIWNGIDRNKLNRWLSSFKNPEERYLAAFILDNLTFRSESQTKAMIFQIILRKIPQLLQEEEYFSKYRDKWPETLTKSGTPIRLVPVLRKNDGPYKSGQIVSREYITQVGVNKRIIISPDQIDKSIKDGAKLFIFIDDFLGTGNQFSEFYEENQKIIEVNNITTLYVPLAAHEYGVEKVKSKFPNLRLAASEILSENNGLFFSDNGMLPDNINTCDAAKALYLSISQSLLGTGFSMPLGYEDLSLTYGFNHATPNATLPLLWSDKIENHFLTRC
ncbi:hypothetical protein GCM10011352_10440 [Marinobacterium zhoushanense]|uniref:PRTase-CE domain-containing protein n=1 Tax=Marinobacterium zhoushanense TaxID=1679163 RepID=A0ABQ1K711_9GAMM|nr:hypothetical protein [Marinobacterium zhoushanense]GGB86450.1 hypothetical protein GCM10011352_10440 [Marinobacterium zhoushanense]